VRLRRGTVVIASALALLVSGCGGAEEAGADDESSVIVELKELSGSAQSGTARLTKVGEQTRVVLEVQSKSAQSGSPVAAPQPAHIHSGSCNQLNEIPEYALKDVRGGKSTTTVDVPLDALRRGVFAISVHESAAESEVYVACGDIRTSDESGGSPPGDDKESDY
jgi:hypothetical protein